VDSTTHICLEISHNKVYCKHLLIEADRHKKWSKTYRKKIKIIKWLLNKEVQMCRTHRTDDSWDFSLRVEKKQDLKLYSPRSSKHTLPRRYLVPKYRKVWRYKLNFNFIYAHKNCTAFAAMILWHTEVLNRVIWCGFITRNVTHQEMWKYGRYSFKLLRKAWLPLSRFSRNSCLFDKFL